MSWTLASFLILFLALAAGFAWYERSQAPAKMVALVAALAALAAAGRVAFAPIPNVKPTTDIVILAGFALGAAPGFAVGAVAAISSNVIFGQGPWTPWQMLAWGLCGVLGAALGHASRHGMNRWWLALWCALAAIGFGALMDFSTWITYTGTHSIASYLAILGTSLPFTIAHAVGNVVFCLAFGPAFLRALMRYRDRFTVDWRAAVPPVVAAGALLAALLVAGGITAPGSADAAPTATARAVAYLKGTQHQDGGWGAERAGASASLFTDWAAMGLAAAGVPVRTLHHGGTTVGARILADARSATAVGDLERTILAAHAARVAVPSLVTKLRAGQSASGAFSGLANLTAFGIIALRAAGETSSASPVRRAGTWLAAQATASGGYGYAGTRGTADVDDTAAVLQALGRSGQQRSAAATRALDWLVRQQNADGGFPLQPGEGSNAQSTAWAVQALVLLGRDVDALHARGTRTPLQYLRSLQQADGSIRYSRTVVQTPTWVTATALLALAKRPLPVASPR